MSEFRTLPYNGYYPSSLSAFKSAAKYSPRGYIYPQVCSPLDKNDGPWRDSGNIGEVSLPGGTLDKQTDVFGDSAKKIMNRDPDPGDNRFDWHFETNENKSTFTRVFDFCHPSLAITGNGGGVYSDQVQGCFYHDVTSIWGIFNNRNLQTKNDTYSFIERLGLIYVQKVDTGVWKRVLECTVKLPGSIKINSENHGTRQNELLFGHGITASERTMINNGYYKFVGFRVQLKVGRRGSGTIPQYLQGGVTCLTPGLGDYNQTTGNKRLIMRTIDTWDNKSRYKFNTI